LIEFDHAEYLRQQVFHHGRSLHDMIRLHILHVCDLGARDKLSEAKEHCMSVLRELGEALPKNPTKLHVLLAVLKSRRKVRGMSDEALLCLPNMSDVDKLAVMQILNVMFLNVYFIDPLLTALVAVRMVSLSLDYGLSSISSAGFAFYGVLSCSCRVDTEFGYRCGQLALRVLEKFKCAEFVPRVYAPVYGFINSWKFEFSAALEPLKYAYDVGLETGDIEFAMVNASLFGVSLLVFTWGNAFPVTHLGFPLSDHVLHHGEVPGVLRKPNRFFCGSAGVAQSREFSLDVAIRAATD
jgi:hypothetical protein